MEHALSALGIPRGKSGRAGFRRDGGRSLRGLCSHGSHKHGYLIEELGIVMPRTQGAGVLLFFNLGMGKAGNF